jgi:hypothetical protein
VPGGRGRNFTWRWAWQTPRGPRGRELVRWRMGGRMPERRTSSSRSRFSFRCGRLQHSEGAKGGVGLGCGYWCGVVGVCRRPHPHQPETEAGRRSWTWRSHLGPRRKGEELPVPPSFPTTPSSADYEAVRARGALRPGGVLRRPSLAAAACLQHQQLHCSDDGRRVNDCAPQLAFSPLAFSPLPVACLRATSECARSYLSAHRAPSLVPSAEPRQEIPKAKPSS